MAQAELDISGITTLTGLLQRLPLGEATRMLLQRLAVWNTRHHENAAGRQRRWNVNFSDLEDDSLSNEYAYWSGELMRVHELAGLLDGQRKLLELQAKKARAHARSKIRQEYEERVREEATKEKPEKIPKPTAGEINDRAEDDEDVTSADSDLVMLDVVLAGVHAYRESCITATQGLSREISFRQAQFTARIRS